MDKYEKLYNEALERFKSFKEKYYTKDTTLGDVIFDKNGEMQKDFNGIFPELRESEDERIRKELIEFIKSLLCNDAFDRYKLGSWITWLEKQKENPKSADSIPSDCVSDAKYEDRSPKHSDSDGTDIRDTPAYWKGWDDAMKQKEQNHPNGCFTCDEYKKGYEAGRLNGFTAGYNKAMKEVDQKEQKQEWSEEDEHRREGVVEWLRDHQKTIDRNSNNQAYESIESLISWLKSLRPQPKRDGGDDYNKGYINGRAVALKESWKPSEEQMDSLRDTIIQTKGYSYSVYLPELYEQLKKL